MRKFAFIFLTSLLFCACAKDDVNYGMIPQVESTEYVTIVSTFDPDNETGTDFEELLNGKYASASYIKVVGRMRDADLTALGAVNTFKGIDLSDVAIIGSIAVNSTVSSETDQDLGVDLPNTTKHAAIPKQLYDVAATANSTLVELILPDNLSAIGRSAFFGNTKLERLIFKTPSEAVMEEYANYYTLSESDDVTEPIDLSANTLDFYPGAFGGCTSLKSITYQDASGKEYESLENTLPLTTKSIYFGAFKECSGLQELDLSGCINLKTIDSQAFQSCTSLVAIDIPNTVEIIGSKAFMGCDAMSSIKLNWDTSMAVSVTSDTFPESFMRQARHYAIRIPDGFDTDVEGVTTTLKSIYNLSAGWPYYWLTTTSEAEDANSDELLVDEFPIVCEAEDADGDGIYTSNLYEQLVKYYGEDFNEKYRTDGTLRDNGTLVVGGYITAADFFYMGTFSSIYFTKVIGSTSYTLSVVYPGEYMGVKYERDYIPDGVFENNEVVSLVNLNTISTLIGKRAFKNSAITKLVVAAGCNVTLYGEECFMNCKNLKSIGFFPNKSNYTIEKSAFEGCENLALTNKVTNYAGTGLMFNSGDPSVTYDVNKYVGLTYLGERAFYGCQKLANNGVLTLGDGSKVKALFLPTTLTTICKDAFAECTFEAICGVWDPAFKKMPTIPASAVPSTCKYLCVVEGAEGLYNTTEGWHDLGLEMSTGASAVAVNVADVAAYDKSAVHLAEGHSADLGDMLVTFQKSNPAGTGSAINFSGYMTSADISDLNEHCKVAGQGWETVDLSGLTTMTSTTGTFLPEAHAVKNIIFPSCSFAISGPVGAGTTTMEKIEFNWTSVSSYTASTIISSGTNVNTATVVNVYTRAYSDGDTNGKVAYAGATVRDVDFMGEVETTTNGITTTVTTTLVGSYTGATKTIDTTAFVFESGSITQVKTDVVVSNTTFPSNFLRGKSGVIEAPVDLSSVAGWKDYNVK